MSKRSGSIKGRRQSQADLVDDLGDQDNYAMEPEEQDWAAEEIKAPEDQIALTETELDEVFTKTITAADPNVATTIHRYDYTKGEFVAETAIDHLAVHFSMLGDLIEKDGDEARRQAEYEEMRRTGKKPKKETAEAGTEPEKAGEEAKPAEEETKEGEEEEKKEGDEGDAKEDEEAEKKEEVKEEKKEEEEEDEDLFLKNQFNFSDRATQTYNNPKRNKEMCTEPPPTVEFSASLTNWEVFDGYLNDFEEKQAAAAAAESKKPAVALKKSGDEDEGPPLSLQDESERIFVDEDAQIFNGPTMTRALKMMERMVITNSQADCFQEYKYYEDKNELKREDGRGSFHPLWKFSYKPVDGRTVSAICWNPEFTDLFAVGYGSYDFNTASKQSGMICCFTLKNTSHPEYVIETDSGIMSLDFHPLHSSLLCVGLYDGTVCVYDVKQLDGPNTKPIFLSTDPKHKHTDPVWQVYWSREEPTEDSGLNFFSVSSDGRVTNWILSKNTLVNEEVVALKLITDDDKVKEEDTVVGLAGGCCFDFNRTKEDLFVVGTEEGAIHYYSKAYNAQFLRGFSGHHMAVYSVKWNTFHPKVFLSCSADWTVKLWEVGCSKPVMTFDLNTSVGDIAWAPFSSTVFATITHTDGKVRVFDLAVNKHEPIGEHRLKKAKGNAKLTHISFNPTEPIVCVGDHTGVLTILKLSSNLRKMSAPTLEDIKVEDEIAKLEKVMIMPDDDGEEDIQTLLEAAKRVGNEEEIVEETKEEEKKAE